MVSIDNDCRCLYCAVITMQPVILIKHYIVLMISYIKKRHGQTPPMAMALSSSGDVLIHYRVRLKTPLQKSDYFQNNLIFLVNFSEVIRETFCH